MKTFRYRLYPSRKQTTAMKNVLSSCQWLYNKLLEQRKTTYETKKGTLSLFDQNKLLPSLKTETTRLKDVHSQTLQDVAKRIDLAFKAFFRRCKQGEKPGYPRFKSRDRYHSFTYPQYLASFKLEERNSKHYIYLPKIGKVRIVLHREIEGTVKTCTVKRTPTGKWFVYIVCDDVIPKKLPKNKNTVGIDLGLSSFATLSDGQKIENPRFFQAEQKSLAKVQRSKDKLSKGSLERRRKCRAVARVYERISFRRDNFVHQTSRRIVNKYGIICVEDLDIARMKGKGNKVRLAKGISDVAWGNFLLLLSIKAEEAGRKVIKVNPAYTSQTCSECFAVQKIPLSERIFKCPTCRIEKDRDLNAALNILRVGTHSLRGRRKST